MHNKSEAKEILLKLSVAGPKGMDLARSFIHGYAGIARGVYGHACIKYLANQTVNGVLRIENYSWVYLDAYGTRRVGGSLGDKVVSGVARIGTLLHKSPEACALDRYQIAEDLANSARDVLFELSYRYKK